MNVKPGQLAIIIKSTFPQNVGMICKVIETGTHGTGLAAWTVEMTSPFFASFVSGGFAAHFPAGMTVNIPDPWLRPVSGLPECEDAPAHEKEPA